MVFTPTGPKKPTAPAPSLTSFALVELSVLRDTTELIYGVNNYPQLCTGLCRAITESQALPSALAAMDPLSKLDVGFKDESDFGRIADQRALFKAFLSVEGLERKLPKPFPPGFRKFLTLMRGVLKICRARQAVLEKEKAAEEAAARCAAQRQVTDIDLMEDVEMGMAPASRSIKRKPNFAAQDPPVTKKLKVTPSLPNYSPGSTGALELMERVDATLVSRGNGKLSALDLEDFAETIDEYSTFELFKLDLNMQVIKMLLKRRSAVDRALHSKDIDQTGIAFNDLQVSLKGKEKEEDSIAVDNEEIEIAGPSSKVDEITAAIEGAI
ncbi:hypothetical protein DXG01_002740 [Tephrocybe rancida]|nr:hypothetical protein DXG01_002740 [Tephrocybe rancida]